MNKLIVAICLFLSVPTLAQDLKQAPNWIQRNQDFVDRRTTGQGDNFAKEYYQAYQSIDKARIAHKTGSEWTPLGPFGEQRLAGIGRVNSMQFHPTDSNTWFMCVAQGGLWKTTNAGASWIPVHGDLPILRTTWLAIHPEHPDTMYLATGDYAYLGHNLQANENKRNSHYGLGIYKTTDGGIHWEGTGLSFEQTDFEGSLIDKVLISNSNPDNLVAAGQTGCYVSTDAGANWTKTHDGLFWDLERDPDVDSVLYASTGYVHSYAIGEVSLLKSTDFGQTWTQSNISIPSTGSVQRVELCIAPSDHNYIYALACDSIGGFYGLYRSTNAGLSYQSRALGSTYPINILNWNMTDDPGGQGRYDLALCVDRDDKNKIYVGGVNIWTSTNGGLNFVPVTYWRLNYSDMSLHADIHDIVQHPHNSTLFACHDGGLSRTFNVIPNTIDEMVNDWIADTEWENYTNGLNVTSFYRLGINQNTGEHFMAGAQDNSTVFGDGSDFFNVTGGDGMECLFQDDQFNRYTSSQNGRIYQFFTIGDDDFDYTETISPPSGEIGEWTTPFESGSNGIYIAYGNLYMQSLQGMTRLSNFSDIPGGSFPAPGTALAVDQVNNEVIYLAKRGYSSSSIESQVWASTDGGDNWSDVSDGLPTSLYPSYLEINDAHPDEVWVSFSGFDADNKVFFSANGGDTWDNITYDLPNIPVNCLCIQSDSFPVLYAGTDLGVFYLMPDSSSWTFYSEGLPPVIVSELEINTVTGMLTAATFGRGVWEAELLPTPVDTVSAHIQELSQFNITLGPNPTRNEVLVTYHGLDKTGMTLSVIDVTGKVMMKEDLVWVGDGRHSINTESWLSGQYYVVFKSAEGRTVRKFIKL